VISILLQIAGCALVKTTGNLLLERLQWIGMKPNARAIAYEKKWNEKWGRFLNFILFHFIYETQEPSPFFPPMFHPNIELFSRPCLFAEREACS